jgi:hypothetical protein
MNVESLGLQDEILNDKNIGSAGEAITCMVLIQMMCLTEGTYCHIITLLMWSGEIAFFSDTLRQFQDGQTGWKDQF